MLGFANSGVIVQMQISVLRKYLRVIDMPHDELKLWIADGAAQEVDNIGVADYICVLA